jgi:ABC-type transport system substrate-binding protein
MKARKIGSFIVAATMSLSLVLSGCGGSSQNENSGNSTGANSSTGTQSTAASGPKQGGTLKIGTGQSVPVLGYTPKITTNASTQFLRISFDSLLFYDNDGKLVADLAEKWETDPSAKTITFHLRSGVKFSDGTDFNADAVKWNIEEYQKMKRTETDNIKSVDAKDANTVVFNLKEWNSSALTSIGYFIYYMSPTAVKTNGTEWAEKNPVGTGPFVLKEWNKGVKQKYVKNDKYWQSGKPYLDGIEISEITEVMTLESSLKAGEIDLITYADLSTVKATEGDSQFVKETNKNGVGVEGFGLIPNSSDPKSPFSKEKVRQAMCYAIDAESIIKTVGFGYIQTTNQWAAPGSVTYDKDVKGYPFDPAKAKQLLAEAGYPNGFDTVLNAVNAGIYGDVCTAAAKQLSDVGIRAKIEIADNTKYSSMMANGWDGLMIHFNSIGPDLGLYMGRHLDPNGAFYAKGILHPQDSLDLLDKIRKAADDQTKIKDSLELQKLIYDKYALFGKPLAVQSINTIKCNYVKDDNFHTPNASAWTPWTVWLNK